FKDYETHQKDKYRVSQQHSQDNPLSNAKKSKRENPVVSSGTSQIPTITGGPTALKAHMVRHTDGFTCTVCGKKFYRKLYLKWHLYKHTGQEPYLCDTCGKGWPTAHLLKLHMSQHTEGRPVHSCARFCSKAFRLNSELKQHMIVHTGERPFPCPRCGKKFKKKCHLRQHGEKACR
uniref:C2H2-type domain-containing protein n=1 Tax=Sparus aurata TaxID=8175 RepID=A0A671Y7S4_SPAAU